MKRGFTYTLLLQWVASLFTIQSRWWRVLVFLSLPLALTALAFWQPVYEPPIFDAQVKYNQEAWKRVSVEAILNGVDDMNVPWLLVGSTPNDGTWKLYAKDPKRVIPMLVPQHTREDRDTWYTSADMLRFIESELGRRPYRGVGEVFLYAKQVNTPVVRRVLTLAANNRLVFHTRSDPEAIQNIFRQQPGLRVLWAHAGVTVPPDQVSQLLDYYPYLWVELSHRRSVAPRGKLDPAWKALMLRHPDRVLIGSGTYNSRYWYQVRTYLSEYRGWLKTLPKDVAENIAYRNGLRLFGISDNREQQKLKQRG